MLNPLRYGLITVLLLLAALPVIAASFIDFADASAGASADSLNYDGVHFSSPDWFINPSGPISNGNELYGTCGIPLDITFDEPQNEVSFLWASASRELSVVVLSGGSVVRTDVFAGDYGSTATITGPFDQLVVGVGSEHGCAAIDDLSYNNGSSTDGTSLVFEDGRINRFDAASPVVLYPATDASGQTGLKFYSSNGVLLFEVSAAEIAAAGECPEVNTLISSFNGIQLFRLAGSNGTCGFQLNAPMPNGKLYVMLFDTLTTDSDYDSYEQ